MTKPETAEAPKIYRCQCCGMELSESGPHPVHAHDCRGECRNCPEPCGPVELSEELVLAALASEREAGRREVSDLVRLTLDAYIGAEDEGVDSVVGDVLRALAALPPFGPPQSSPKEGV